MGIIIMLIVGAIAGWLAGKIVAGYGFDLIGNIVVGILGAVIAGFILPRIGLGFGGGILAAIGAVILLYLIKLARRVWRRGDPPRPPQSAGLSAYHILIRAIGEGGDILRPLFGDENVILALAARAGLTGRDRQHRLHPHP